MKRRILGCVLAAGLGLLANASTATAQVGLPGMANNPYVRPAIPNSLQLAQPGIGAVNANNARINNNNALRFNNLQQQIQQLPGTMQQIGGPVAEEDELLTQGYAITGHPSMFMNYSHYYGQNSATVRPAAVPLGIGRRY